MTKSTQDKHWREKRAYAARHTALSKQPTLETASTGTILRALVKRLLRHGGKA